jgi:hypothetical protein
MLKNLADDRLKLVAYTIVFAKPGHERIMPGGQGSILVDVSLTEAQFIAMLIARYLRPEEGEPPKLAGIFTSPRDRKYLKVHYVVSTRWPKEPLEIDSRQSDALEAIRDRIVGARGM